MKICPFTIGKILNPNEFINRENELNSILGRIITGQSTAIIGQPHIGKSSFISFMKEIELHKNVVGDTLNRTLFSEIDSHMVGDDFNQCNFWEIVLNPFENLLQSEFLKKSYQNSKNHNFDPFTLEQFFRSLENENRRYVLIIDEFDVLLAHPNLNSAEFFGSLRSLASRCSAFVLVISSRRSLHALNRETQKFNSYGSPYFNVFTEIRLGPLPKWHSEELLYKANGVFNKEDIDYIFRVSGRHPYLLQLSASVLWTYKIENKTDTTSYKQIGDKIYEAAYQHFDDTWRSWSEEHKRIVTAAALVQLYNFIKKSNLDSPSITKDIENYSRELRDLKSDGILAEGEKNTLIITQQAFLWWLADEIRSVIRDNTRFDAWLCKHKMDGILSVNEKERLGSAINTVNTMIKDGAQSLIKASAEGLGKAMTS
jgi:hypothetical protein